MAAGLVMVVAAAAVAVAVSSWSRHFGPWVAGRVPQVADIAMKMGRLIKKWISF